MIDTQASSASNVVEGNRRTLRNAHVLGVTLCGDAGVGKTFDPQVFDRDVRRLNRDAPVLQVSAAQGTGMNQWECWLRDQIGRVRRLRAAEWLEPPEVFLG